MNDQNENNRFSGEENQEGNGENFHSPENPRETETDSFRNAEQEYQRTSNYYQNPNAPDGSGNPSASRPERSGESASREAPNPQEGAASREGGQGSWNSQQSGPSQQGNSGPFTGWQSYNGSQQGPSSSGGSGAGGSGTPNGGYPYGSQQNGPYSQGGPSGGAYGGNGGTGAPNGGTPFGGAPTGGAEPPRQQPERPQAERPQEYQWSYEDYDKLSQGNPGYKPKSNTGLKVFAIVISAVFVITAAAFAGFILYSNRDTSVLPDNSASTSEPRKDGPQLSLDNRPAPDEEEYTGGVLSTEEIAAKVRPSVVGIETYKTEYPMQVYGTGSGIIMSSDGYIITNAHVVSGATGGIVVVLDNNEEYEAEIIGIDEKTDIAVIKIEANNLTTAEFGNSDELVVGERIVAIGNPTGLNLAGSTTQGIVSGLKRTIQVQNEETGETIEMEAIQVDAAINPGNSGGALINKYGQIVGINSSKLASTQIEGIGFAIPISTAKPIVDDLISYGYVKGRVLLGITYVAISDVQGALLGYTPGLWVQSVREDMDVYAKGVRAGDIITQIDGQDVRDTETVKEIMSKKKPGDTIELNIVQQSATGKVKTFTVKVELSEDKGTSVQQQQPETPSQGGGLQQLPFGR